MFCSLHYTHLHRKIPIRSAACSFCRSVLVATQPVTKHTALQRLTWEPVVLLVHCRHNYSLFLLVCVCVCLSDISLFSVRPMISVWHKPVVILQQCPFAIDFCRTNNILVSHDVSAAGPAPIVAVSVRRNPVAIPFMLPRIICSGLSMFSCALPQLGLLTSCFLQHTNLTICTSLKLSRKMYRFPLLHYSTLGVVFVFGFQIYILSHFVVIWDWKNLHEYQSQSRISVSIPSVWRLFSSKNPWDSKKVKVKM